ncbi:MAG TPA: ABC transporter ATP-binding protein [Gemmatimonadaceae bacterium]|nr:ABC transporter ATP-binding protein [Gemmatimonadaceae bacterium]
MIAIRAEELGKQFTITSAGAPTWRDYLRSPRAAAKRPRAHVIDALKDVSFEVNEGEVFGIIGRNGAGKSTLLKILSRITAPSSGRATIRGRVASLLEVGTGFHPELTGRENVYLNGMLLGMPRREVDRVFDAIVEFAGVETFIDTPIKRYSSGMQLRLAFAVAANLAADTVIIDEVLAVGDAEFQEKCTRTMKASTERGRTTLFVSHNMALVENLCSRTMLLKGGEVAAIGATRDVVRSYLRGVIATEACVDYIAPSDRDSSSAAVLCSARVRGADGSAPVQGEEAIFVAHINVRAPIRQLQLWLGVSTVEGERVAALNNADYRLDWSVTAGTYRLEVRLPALRLLPRRYSVTVRLQHRTGEVFDEVTDAVVFSVLERDVLGTGVPLLADRGITWLPAIMSIASAGADQVSPPDLTRSIA